MWDINDNDPETRLHELFEQKQTEQFHQAGQSLMIEIQNDAQNTLKFDTEAQGPDSKGFTMIAIRQQSLGKSKQNKNKVVLFSYYGKLNSGKNNLSVLELQDTSMITCLKQFNTRYLACATIKCIEIFDLVSRESIRQISDLGLSLYWIFHANPPFHNKQYYH